MSTLEFSRPWKKKSESPVPSKARGQGISPLVLVVDDDLTMRTLVRACLEQAGYRAEEITDGINLVPAVKRYHPDVVLLDVMMPEMDGFRACAELRKVPEGEQIPVIMMTGLEDISYIHEAYEVGATDFFTKPINWALLPHRLQYILRSSQAFREVRSLAEENAIIAAIGRIISSTQDIESVYDRFAGEVRKIISFEHISIKIVIEKEEVLTIAHDAGADIPGWKKGAVIPLSGTATERVRRTRSGFIQSRENGKGDVPIPALLPVFSAGFQTVLAVPLLSNDRVIGSMLVSSFKVGAYGERELSVTQKVGHQISGAIANAQLFMERNLAQQETKILEEQLRHAQKMEAVGQLAGGIAHDFNNSLTLIRLNSQLALQDIGGSGPVRESLLKIEAATERSGNLARQLLTFSRRQESRTQALDLNQLFRNLQEMLLRTIGENIELVTHLAEDLGRIEVDPGQMEQVVLNLALNARDAMSRGGNLTIETANVYLDDQYARFHIRVAPGPYVMFSVKDTGCGIPPEAKERIFDPFFTTKEPGKGTGLGLFMVYGLVQKNGGHITFDSDPGRGTTFKVYFPRNLKEGSVVEGEEPENRLLRGRESILLAEDEGEIREAVAHFLIAQGYEVLKAQNGEEALRIFQTRKSDIHLLLTDIVMPKMDGFDLVKLVGPLFPDLKVVYMSGYAEGPHWPKDVLRKENFISKPFSLQMLSAKIRKCFDADGGSHPPSAPERPPALV